MRRTSATMGCARLVQRPFREEFYVWSTMQRPSCASLDLLNASHESVPMRPRHLPAYATASCSRTDIGDRVAQLPRVARRFHDVVLITSDLRVSMLRALRG